MHLPLLEMKKETVRRRNVMKYLNKSKTKNNFLYSLPSRSRHSPYITCCQQPSIKLGNHTLCRHRYCWSSHPASATGVLPLLLRQQRHCCCCFFAVSCSAGGINRTIGRDTYLCIRHCLSVASCQSSEQGYTCRLCRVVLATTQ
jgi:hypothetical protein